MAKDRERVCEYYEYHGCCKKHPNSRCRHNKECQKCKDYRALAGAKPRRTDDRRKKAERQFRKGVW